MDRLTEIVSKYGGKDYPDKCDCDPDVDSMCLACSVLRDLQTIERVVKSAMISVACSYMGLIEDERKKKFAIEVMDDRIMECIERSWKEES